MRQHPDYANVFVDNQGNARPKWAVSNPVLQRYFDTEWGRPVHDEQGLFERLSLEGFQAGLSWLTILSKREAFREAFADFDPEVVARFSDDDVHRLLTNSSIVRNEQKIRAVITNASATITLRNHGGLSELIWSYQPAENPRLDQDGYPPTQSPESVALAKKLKLYGFRFVGPTTIFAMLEAIGVIDTFPFREPWNLSEHITAN